MLEREGRVERPMESKVARRGTSHSIVVEGTSASAYLFSQTLICEVVLSRLTRRPHYGQK